MERGKVKVLVVGGGTAGFIAALILKNHLDIDVDVVYSNKIGTIGVGEGSTEHFKQFMDFCGITNKEIIGEADATYKAGLVFENWTETPYMHSVGKEFAYNRAQDFSVMYSKTLSEGSKDFSHKFFWQNKINSWFIEEGYPEAPTYQYHFNSLKLIDFLKNKSISQGIGVFEDEIIDISINSSGNIDYVLGNKQKYEYEQRNISS